ncbi:unnamed protein product [Symbiodinium microadriaticum]|nr:unnamed protein product [Symbiodinium microadriaticum]
MAFPPRSYRSFAAALRQEEALELRLRAETRQAQVESAALRDSIYLEALQQRAVEESAAALALELHGAKTQAAEVWQEYEAPLAGEAAAMATLRMQTQELREKNAGHVAAEHRLREQLQALLSEVTDLCQHSEAHEEHHDDLHRKVGDTSDLLQRMQQEHSEQEVALSHAQTGASRHQEDLHKLERIASAHQGRVHAANVEIAQLASKLEELQLPTESFSEASGGCSMSYTRGKKSSRLLAAMLQHFAAGLCGPNPCCGF